MSTPQIDMICFHADCITNKQQLFHYDSEAGGIHDDHDCANIHPHNFNRKYGCQASALKEVKEGLDNSLALIIQEMTDRFAGFLRERLREKACELYDCELSEFRPSSCQSLLERIKKQEGEYEVEVLNCLFLEDVQGMKRLANVKVSKCQQNLTAYLEQLYSRFTTSFEQIIQNSPQTPIQTAPPSKMEAEESIKVECEIVELNSQSLQVEQEVPPSSQKEKEPNQQNNINCSNTVEHREDPNTDIRKYFKRKEKPIHKESRPEGILRRLRMDKLNTPPQNTSTFFPHSYQDFQIRDYTIRNDMDLVEALQQSSPCERLIVYYPLSEDKLVKLIKRVTPSEIYLNYQIKLSSEFMDSLPSKQLVRFEEFWDHCRFFDEIINRQHFPIDDFRNVKSVHKLHLSMKQWGGFSRLSNAWLSNYYDIQQLKHSKKRIADIESLRVEGCRCCNNLNQYAITEIFRAFKDSSSLKTFVLKCDALNEENIKLLRELTLKNRNIMCVIIQIEGKYIQKKVLEAFSKLPLTILSINRELNNDGDNVYMDITPIIRIKTLRKLAITNMFFTTQETVLNNSTCMDNVDLQEDVVTEINQLTELVFLDLYRCSPIYSTIVSELSPRVKNRLYHLNLSHTLMDSSIIPELQLLPRLQQLNLDRTSLDLKEFFRELMKKPIVTVSKLSLFNYNGDDLDEVDMVGEPTLIKFSELNNQEIDKISTCFPNLEYLNIAFCRHFSELSELKFKKLKYLCSNKEFISGGKIEKMKHHRGIEVYLYDGVFPAWKIPQHKPKSK